MPNDEEIELTAAVGDADQVTLWLLDADTVEVGDDGIVTFNVDDDGAFDPGTAAVADVSITEVGDVTFGTPAVVRTTTDIADGEVTFTVAGRDNDNTEVVAVVTEGAASAVLDGTEAILADDGGLEAAFGVSDTLVFHDINQFLIDDGTADNNWQEDLTGGDAIEVAEGASTTLSVALSDGDNDEGDGIAPLDGETVLYRIVEAGDRDPADTWASIGPDDKDVVAISGSATTEDGIAEIEIDGTNVDDDDDNWFVFVRWVGTDGYDDEVVDGPDGGIAEIDWQTDEVVINAVTFSDAVNAAAVGSSQSFTVTVTDELNRPVVGAEVTFGVNQDGDVLTTTGTDFDNADITVGPRTTDADGQASFTLTAPAEDGAVHRVGAIVEAPEGSDDISGDAEVLNGWVSWYEAIEAAADGVDGSGDITFVAEDGSWAVLVGDDTANGDIAEDRVVRVNFPAAGDARFFTGTAVNDLDGADLAAGTTSVTRAAFLEELTDGFTPATDTVQFTGFLDSDADPATPDFLLD